MNRRQLDLIPDRLVVRTRRMFDEVMSKTFDALFDEPDIVPLIAAVAEGSAALVITGGTLQIARVDHVERASRVPQVADDDMPGMYL